MLLLEVSRVKSCVQNKLYFNDVSISAKTNMSWLLLTFRPETNIDSFSTDKILCGSKGNIKYCVAVKGI